MRRRASVAAVGVVAIACLWLSPAAAQQANFDDVVKRLRHPDPNERVSAMRLLAEAGYPEAIAPVAMLVTNPDEAVQMEAIDTEVGLYLGRRLSTRRRVAGVIEIRDRRLAEAAFAEGPGAVALYTVPPELLTALVAAMRDDHPRVRLEAIYALGVILPPALPLPDTAVLFPVVGILAERAADVDPGQRLAAARVTARLFEECRTGCGALDRTEIGDVLIGGMNDHEPAVRVASMRALGALGYDRAVQALTERFEYYKHGESAVAALDALARIAHRSSLPLFRSALESTDPEIRVLAIEGIARGGDQAVVREVEAKLGADRSPQVALALNYAAQWHSSGRDVNQLVNALGSADTRKQAARYLIELGPRTAASLLGYLPDPSPVIRATLCEVIGANGDAAAVSALQRRVEDRDPKVSVAAQRAIARIKARLGALAPTAQ